MEKIIPKDMQQMLIEVCDLLIAKEEELCRLDSYVGDGDHGLTIRRGFSEVKEKLLTEKYADSGKILTDTGKILEDVMGGAIGPIFGGLFSAMGEVVSASDIIVAADLAAMFRSGLENVKMIGGAKIGDRTLVDALEPAVEVMEAASKRGIPLTDVLNETEQAAKLGAESTMKMAAKKGRAKFLQEKSIGYQDAGATSMYLVFSAMAQYCLERAT